MDHQNDKQLNQNNQNQEPSWTDVRRKLFRFLRSMPFSFFLLAIILIACFAGSIIPQNAYVRSYVETYGVYGAKVIQTLQLDHVFTCWWFIFVALFLCLNLLLCSVFRFPAVYRVWKNAEHKTYGMWGSWVTHLGFFLVIISFGISQYTSSEAVVYGIPGSTQPLGDTGLTIQIDAFDVLLREDYTVDQYVATLTVTNSNGISKTGTASVNHPFDAFGYSFYQDSTGWANYIDLYENGQLIKTDLLCVGEYTFPDNMPTLSIMLNRFYPDMIQDEQGGFSTATPLLNNPHTIYSVYYNGQVMSMNITEPDQIINIHNYAFRFYDPVEYTLIVAKTDPASWMVGASALILAFGLVLTFYIRPWEQNRRTKNANKPNSDKC